MEGLLCLFLAGLVTVSQAQDQPNIIFVIVDDLGWADVGFHNSKVTTPNIDRLASEGVVLDQSYVHPLCSPTRAAILSGMYPQNIGLQHNVILSTVPHYMSPDLDLLPEALKDLGYSTHMVGKWHLGFCKWDVTPLFQGFDTFFGSYNWGGPQWNHTHEIWQVARFEGIDLNNQGVGVDQYDGIHSTDLYTDKAIEILRNHDKESPMFMYLSYKAVHDPIEPPAEYLPMYDDVEDEDRKKFLAFTTHLDDGFGRFVEALEETGMDDNTLLVFITDNGGDPRADHGGYNWPLRGMKGTPWEGGTRATTFVWGDVLRQKQYVNDGLFHATDWYPTLLNIAGGNVENWDKDGVDQTEMLLNGQASERDEMVYHINERVSPFQGVVRGGSYKFILGETQWWTESNNDWFYPPELEESSQAKHKIPVVSHNAPPTTHNCTFPAEWDRQLYNVEEDPEERENLYDDLPEIASQLEDRLCYYVENMQEAFYPLTNYTGAANPDNFGGYWSPGWCEDEDSSDLS